MSSSRGKFPFLDGQHRDSSRGEKYSMLQATRAGLSRHPTMRVAEQPQEKEARGPTRNNIIRATPPPEACENYHSACCAACLSGFREISCWPKFLLYIPYSQVARGQRSCSKTFRSRPPIFVEFPSVVSYNGLLPVVPSCFPISLLLTSSPQPRLYFLPLTTKLKPQP